MRLEDSHLTWRYDPRAGTVTSGSLFDCVDARSEGDPVRTADLGDARLVVTDDAGTAETAHTAGVPVLLVAADDVALTRPGFVVVEDRDDLVAVLPWAIDRGRAMFAAPPPRSVSDLRWLTAIRESAREDELTRRSDRARAWDRMDWEIEMRDAHIQRLEADIVTIEGRVAELGAHIDGIESSRAYRASLVVRGAAGCVRRLVRPGSGRDRAAPPRLDTVPVDTASVAVMSRPRRPPAAHPSLPAATASWSRPPRISVVVPTRDRPDLLRRVLLGLEETSRPHEVVLVDNGTSDEEARRILDSVSHRVVPAPIDFNFARLVNRGVAEASGDVVILLNNDIEIRDPGWMDALVAGLAPVEVGAVGALLTYPDGTIQHCGIALGADGPEHPYIGCDRDAVPVEIRSGVRRVTAVSGACLAIRAGDYWAVDGLDALLAANYNDVDLCLRLGRAGREIRIVSDIDLVHHEGATRTRDTTPDVVADWLLFRSRWRDVLAAGDSHWPVATWASAEPAASTVRGDAPEH